MPHADNSAEQIDALLRQVRSIAVVGASADPSKASYEVMDYLINHGYEVVAVNPVTEHTHILGVPVFKTLADIPHPIDMVDVFRPKAELHSVAEQAIAINAKVLWGQLDIVDEDAAEFARSKGLEVVMDRCPKIELERSNVLPSKS